MRSMAVISGEWGSKSIAGDMVLVGHLFHLTTTAEAKCSCAMTCSCCPLSRLYLKPGKVRHRTDIRWIVAVSLNREQSRDEPVADSPRAEAHTKIFIQFPGIGKPQSSLSLHLGLHLYCRKRPWRCVWEYDQQLRHKVVVIAAQRSEMGKLMALFGAMEVQTRQVENRSSAARLRYSIKQSWTYSVVRVCSHYNLILTAKCNAEREEVISLIITPLGRILHAL